MLLRTLLIAVTFLVALPPGARADRDDRFDRQRGDERDPGRDPGRDPERGPEKEKPRREMSLDQAVQMVQKRYKARVVSAETRRQNDRTVYRLKLLNKDGKVWTVTVDAATGTVR